MPTLSERLLSSASVKDMAYRLVLESDVLEAAAELDRREARLTALEEALKIISECPDVAVHLMPLAAQAALKG